MLVCLYLPALCRIAFKTGFTVLPLVCWCIILEHNNDLGRTVEGGNDSRMHAESTVVSSFRIRTDHAGSGITMKPYSILEVQAWLILQSLVDATL